MHTILCMYFDRNIDLSEKVRSEGNYLSSALNEEIYSNGNTIALEIMRK